MEHNMGKQFKVFNRMFMEAENSFSILKFYYGGITNLLCRRADDFHEYADELEEEYKKRQRPFDKSHWLKHFDVYSEVYPRLFNNSFIISACSLFEFHIRKICTLVKEEHKVLLEWEDMTGSVPHRAKSFLWHGGILLRDDPPVIIPSLEERVIADKLWQEIENYFRVRNCIAHHNGLIQKLRYPAKVIKYASRKGIMAEDKGQLELFLNQDFNREVCDTMMKFFGKVTSAYYSAPLPE